MRLASGAAFRGRLSGTTEKGAQTRIVRNISGVNTNMSNHSRLRERIVLRIRDVVLVDEVGFHGNNGDRDGGGG